MTRSLFLALVPATLVAILIGCAKQEAPPASPAPEQEARVKRGDTPKDGWQPGQTADDRKSDKESRDGAQKSDPAQGGENKPGEGKGDGLASSSKPSPQD